jgi:hypothetical protein
MSDNYRNCKRRKIIINTVSNEQDTNDINNKIKILINNVNKNNEILKLILESRKEIIKRLDNIEKLINKDENDMCEDMKNAYI